MPILFEANPLDRAVTDGPDTPEQQAGRSAPKGVGRSQLVRGLDATAAASIIIGIVIGSGIFRTPDTVATIVGASGLIFVTYIVAGLLVLIGALCYAELGAMLPKAGGPYIYLREAFGDRMAFLLGWASFTITQVGSLAAVAVFFGELGGVIFEYGSNPVSIKAVAISAIVLLAFTNILGVRLAGNVQVAFTVFKLLALGAVIVVGIYLGSGEPTTLTPVFPTTFDLSIVGLVGLAMVPALFAYDGWTNANNVAEEIEDVQKNLPRALILGVTLVIGVYLLANFAYLWSLGLGGTQDSGGAAAANVFTDAFGDCIEIAGGCIPPAKLITGVIFISLFGSLNGQTISYPRLFYAMARDGLFFRGVDRTHPRFKTPHVAIIAQTIWAIFLVLFFGTFEELAEYVIFASFLFYALAVMGLIVLRVRRPEWERPYKVPLYPWLPLIFITVTLVFTVNLALESPVNSLIGIGLVLLGLPAYYVMKAIGGGPQDEEQEMP